MRQLAILGALVLFLLLGLVGRAVSQPTTISGRVVDTQGRPVAYANVFASSDSLARRSLTYTASKDNGAFTLQLSEGVEGSVWITVRSMGYSVFRKRYSLQAMPSPLRVVMAEETIGIEGVRVVVDAKNMYAKGDTLVYSTGYYAKGNERNIGEVIRKMPGMEVSRSGQLSFQGKQIDKILVNGKDLLSSSTGTTLNTLPADFAQSVEVIKDYQDGDVANRYRAERQMALNLKAKHPIKLNGYVEGGRRGGRTLQREGLAHRAYGRYVSERIGQRQQYRAADLHPERLSSKRGGEGGSAGGRKGAYQRALIYSRGGAACGLPQG